ETWAAAGALSLDYRLDPLALRARLKAAYPSEEIPEPHLADLAHQIEAQICRYQTVKEEVDVALALVKETGFTKEHDEHGGDVYVTEIVYQTAKEHLMVRD